MKATVTVLVENTSLRDDLGTEHGLSFLIETGDHCLLFDTGQSDLVLNNATSLGKDLSQVSELVLSHGHYDHVGGAGAILERTSKLRVWAHPSVFIERYSIKDPHDPRMIGMPDIVKNELRNGKLLSCQSFQEIMHGISATGEIPRTYAEEDTGGPFFLDKNGTIPDPIVDDQAICFATHRGLVILFGCAHSGIVNTVEHCMQQTGERRVMGLIGGFHLLQAHPERLAMTFDFLQKLHPEFIAPGHCTGAHVISELNTRFPGKLLSCSAGSVFELDIL